MKVKTGRKIKPPAIVELELYVQWKANAFLKLSDTKLLSQIITKNSIRLVQPQRL